MFGMFDFQNTEIPELIRTTKSSERDTITGSSSISKTSSPTVKNICLNNQTIAIFWY